MNNKGQAVLWGIIILVIAVILFVALVPTMAELIQDSKGCDSFNCVDYYDTDATTGSSACTSGNQTYVSTMDTNTFGCSMIDLSIPLLVIIVVSGLAIKLIKGGLTEEPQPAYSYPGGY